jgi:hypothetical protein
LHVHPKGHSPALRPDIQGTRSAGAWPAEPRSNLPEETFQASATSAPADPKPPAREAAIEIVASSDVSEASLAKLQETASQAMAYFEQHFGPVTSPLRFEVGKAADGLRTGYNFVTQAINLPHLDMVKNAGLDSEDVINHEIFHALLLKAYPDLPSPENPKSGEVRLHEGLADLFAHRLQPDAHFGENYFADQPYLRAYGTSLKLSLASGHHAQGNALTSLLLAHEVSNEQIKSFLEQGDFRLEALESVSPALAKALAHDASLAVAEQVEGYQHSAKGRYWLKPEAPLQIAFLPNDSLKEAHPNFQVVWTDKQGMPSKNYTFEQTAGNSFQVSGAPDADSEKVIARFYDGDQVIGFKPFYFGVREGAEAS